MFGEDPARLQPDAFFGLFTTFLDAFASARKDNIAMRQKKAEEEKRKKIEMEVGVFSSLDSRYDVDRRTSVSWDNRVTISFITQVGRGESFLT